jgi:hypothetical protein
MTKAEEMSIQAVSPVSAAPGAAEVTAGAVVCAKALAVVAAKAATAAVRVTRR